MAGGISVISCLMQALVTTKMKLENRDSLIIRQPTQANQQAALIYKVLNFKQANPNMRKKAVVLHM
jgi:hypothetical protein